MKKIESLELPADKLYYSIGELEGLLGVEAHTLRYWEEEFGQLDPGSTPGGQRRYSKADIEVVLKIYHLLKKEKYTLEGARRKLQKWSDDPRLLEAADEIHDICETALAEINRFVENEI